MEQIGVVQGEVHDPHVLGEHGQVNGAAQEGHVTHETDQGELRRPSKGTWSTLELFRVRSMTPMSQCTFGGLYKWYTKNETTCITRKLHNAN